MTPSPDPVRRRDLGQLAVRNLTLLTGIGSLLGTAACLWATLPDVPVALTVSSTTAPHVLPTRRPATTPVPAVRRPPLSARPVAVAPSPRPPLASPPAVRSPGRASRPPASLLPTPSPRRRLSTPRVAAPARPPSPTPTPSQATASPRATASASASASSSPRPVITSSPS